MVLGAEGQAAVGGDADAGAAIAEHLAVEGLQQPALPAVGHLNDGCRAAQFDAPNPLSIQPADAIEEVEHFGFAGAAGQRFDLQKRHE